MKNAIFLIGGPGSGKDIIIKESLVHQHIKEYKIEQIKNVKLFEENIVITANAYNFDVIKSVKEEFDNLNYNTFGIFVDVSNNVSKERLSGRNIQEESRVNRLLESKENLEHFKDLFSNLFYFNNSYNFESVEIQEQLKDINKRISIEIFSNNLDLVADVDLNSFVNNFRNKLSEGSNGIYKNFMQDKETKKEKKSNAQDIISNIIPKKGFTPTFDVRTTGDSNLIKTYEAVDSPNAADTGLMGGVQNNPQVGDEPYAQSSYSYDQKINPNRKKNFEKDVNAETNKKELPKRIKKILFRG